MKINFNYCNWLLYLWLLNRKGKIKLSCATPWKLSDSISYKGTLRLHQCRKLVIKALETYSEQNEPKHCDPRLCAMSSLPRGNPVWDCFYGWRSAQDLAARTSLLKALLAQKKKPNFLTIHDDSDVVIEWIGLSAKFLQFHQLYTIHPSTTLIIHETCPQCVHTILTFVTRGC